MAQERVGEFKVAVDRDEDGGFVAHIVGTPLGHFKGPTPFEALGRLLDKFHGAVRGAGFLHGTGFLSFDETSKPRKARKLGRPRKLKTRSPKAPKERPVRLFPCPDPKTERCGEGFGSKAALAIHVRSKLHGGPKKKAEKGPV